MTLKECYAALGGDYDGVLARLCSENLVRKFVLKFPSDDSYNLLIKSIEDGNAQEAFRAAHTLKGVCGNLGFVALGDSSSALCESLRGGKLDGVSGLLPAVRADYERTIKAIADFAKSQN